MRPILQLCSRLLRPLNVSSFAPSKTRIFSRLYANECKNTNTRNGVVFGVYQEGCEYKYSVDAQAFNDRLSGAISKLLAVSPIPPGSAQLFNNLDKDYPNLVVANIGSQKAGYDSVELLDLAKSNVRQAIGQAVLLLDNEGCTKIFVDGLDCPDTAAEAALLASWKFKAMKSGINQTQQATVEAYSKDDKDLFDRGVVFGSVQNLARMLTEIPPNALTPTYFADQIIRMLCPCGITVDVHDRDWMESKNLNGILEASKGSCEAPLFAVIGYCGGDKNQKPLTLVGHATTYDTGGVCLRGCDDMAYKKRHVASGATLIGLMKGISCLSLPVNVYAYIPLFESGTSGSGIKATDVYTALNGKSVNIDNTKYISRLAVADTITYATRKEAEPQALINVSTLCGVTSRLFGELATPLFTNNVGMWKELERAGSITGDRVWPMPSYERKAQMITRDDIADVAMLGEGGVDLDDLGKSAAFVAQFLTDPNIEFAHLDIGGVCRNNDVVTFPFLRPEFATGRLTRTLLQMIYQMACPHIPPPHK
ncbi:cytosol aminopeptidase-like [Adelges cooleyi]|uniref:cytosol aminopeptidase-like n=1 Tax=Adelges cooleyi TaxID=133065 RepID=UPI00217FCC1E|nr:cytosol aminopeptidase-like [Adelges cooleyi]